MEKDFSVKEINVKERETFQNEGNLSDVHKDTKLVETTGTTVQRIIRKKKLVLSPSTNKGQAILHSLGLN